MLTFRYQIVTINGITDFAIQYQHSNSEFDIYFDTDFIPTLISILISIPVVYKQI